MTDYGFRLVGCGPHGCQAPQKQAEIDRLRAELAEKANLLHYAYAENETLTRNAEKAEAERDAFRTELDRYAASWAVQQRELERLRAQLARTIKSARFDREAETEARQKAEAAIARVRELCDQAAGSYLPSDFDAMVLLALGVE